MALNFPNSPSISDTYSYNGKTWTYNGNAWLLTPDTLTTSTIIEGTNLYFTNARVTAHVEATSFSNISATTIAANSFASTGIGVPTIESATNINLSANGANGGAVVIQNSPLRLRGYTDDDIANLTPTAGDLIFNSSNTSIQFYSGNAWLTLSIS